MTRKALLALTGTLSLASLALAQDPFAAGTRWTYAAGFVAPFRPLMELLGELPVDVIQAFFAGLDPMLVLRKFLGFAALDPGGPPGRVASTLDVAVEYAAQFARSVASRLSTLAQNM